MTASPAAVRCRIRSAAVSSTSMSSGSARVRDGAAHLRSPGRGTTAAGPGCGSPGSSAPRRPRWTSGHASRGAVVGGVAEPGHRRAGAQHPAQPAAVEHLPQPAGGVVVAVLEADARAPRGSPRPLRPAARRRRRCARAASPAARRRRGPGTAGREVGVPVVRGADVHDVRRDGVEQGGEVAAKPGQPARSAAAAARPSSTSHTPTSSTRAGGRRREDRVQVDGGDVAAADDGDPQRDPTSPPDAQPAASPPPSRRRPGGTRAAGSDGTSTSIM